MLSEMDERMQARLGELALAKAPEGLFAAVMAGIADPDTYSRLVTALGPVTLAWNERGISGVRVGDPPDFEAWYLSRTGRCCRPADLPAWLADAVRDWLAGRPVPEVRFDLSSLTDFERAVLGKALEIPRGEVRTYGWIARQIGRPLAARAVGTALARNPIPYLIPCHRVVRGDGRLGEYSGGGPDAKRAILELEGASWEVLR